MADGEKIENEGIKHAGLAALPAVELPPLSPAGASSEAPAEAVIEPDVAASPEAAPGEAPEPAPHEAAAPAPNPWFHLSRRMQRRATLAVWVALVACLGAVFGGAIGNGFATYNSANVAGAQQRQAMQQSIDRLAKQVGELKTKLAAATSATHTQIAKISARVDRAASADITGSIPAAHTAAVPLPRPAPHLAAPISRPAVVRDWRILRTRGGMVDVIGRDGVFEVVPGAVLPGLGPVRSVEQRDGHWVVVTRKGIIVSTRDRGYFQDF